VSGKDKAKRVAGGVTQSTHCVNHFAKELGVSKKGCVMKKRKLCSRIHLPKPVGSARLSEDIKNDFRRGVSNFNPSDFKINFLQALDNM
jgi:hypothetical protein